MKIMLDLSPKAILAKAEKFEFSPLQLRTPLTRNCIATDIDYGLDNGCFSGRLNPAWMRLIREARETPPLWACSPDVVGSARRTMELWPQFSRIMNGIPRALVLQDGIEDFEIPWSELACVFVGGTDSFKMSPQAFACAKAARILGKLVHVGRVNTYDRALAWRDYADSCDGSGMSKYDHMLEAVLMAIRGDEMQSSLPIAFNEATTQHRLISS